MACNWGRNGGDGLQFGGGVGGMSSNWGRDRSDGGMACTFGERLGDNL